MDWWESDVRNGDSKQGTAPPPPPLPTCSTAKEQLMPAPFTSLP